MNASGFARLGITTAIAALTMVSNSIAQLLPDVGFDRDDFLVSGTNPYDGVLVLNSDLSIKGQIFGGLPLFSAGLDFDAQGRLVARMSPQTPRGALAGVFEPTGRMPPEYPDFIINRNGTLDLKVTANDTYIAAAQDAVFGDPNGLLEFDRQGNLLRSFDTGLDYEGVAVLGDGTIWAGGGRHLRWVPQCVRSRDG